MKQILFLLVFGLIFLGCKEDVSNDKYYVKYSVSSKTIYYGGKLDVKLNTPSGNQSFNVNQNTDWETTIGPVSKGFICKMNVLKQGWDGVSQENHLKLSVKIEMSKNDSPFTLVKNDDLTTPRPSCEISYTIN
jgi:hypothetical protein